MDINSWPQYPVPTEMNCIPIDLHCSIKSTENLTVSQRLTNIYFEFYGDDFACPRIKIHGTSHGLISMGTISSSHGLISMEPISSHGLKSVATIWHVPDGTNCFMVITTADSEHAEPLGSVEIVAPDFNPG